MSGRELPAGYPEERWPGWGAVSLSLADNRLCGVRIKLFTLVASANAKPGQLILPCSAWTEMLQFLSIEPVSVGGFLPCKTWSLVQEAKPRAAELQVLPHYLLAKYSF